MKKDTNFCKVFVGGLPHDIKEDVLRDFFNNYGTVSDLFIFLNKIHHFKTTSLSFILHLFDRIGYRSSDHVRSREKENQRYANQSSKNKSFINLNSNH